MKREEIIHKLSVHKEELRSLGIKSVAIFGSAARDEITADSDVDVLVEFEGQATFDAYMETKFFLEDLLSHRVDLVTPEAIRSRIQPQIEKEAIYVTCLWDVIENKIPLLRTQIAEILKSEDDYS